MNIIEFYNGISPYLFKYIFISQQCYIISQYIGLVHILFTSLLNINFSDFFGRFLKIVYIFMASAETVLLLPFLSLRCFISFHTLFYYWGTQ